MHNIISNIPVTNPNQYPKLRYKPATLYYLRICFPNIINNNNGTSGQSGEVAGTVLYKLGYTTTSLQERVYGKSATYYYNRQHKRVRVAGHVGMGLPTGTTVHVIAAYQHSNASMVYQWEQWLHNKYTSARYCGQAVMVNGNTELYVRDILELDN